MPEKQNPIAAGDRVSWISLVCTSTESNSLSDYRIQHLITNYGINFSHARTVVQLAFGGGEHED